MSNFICSECGMTNIDCGGAGYKTPKEIELEKENKRLQEQIKEANELIKDYVHDANDCFTMGRINRYKEKWGVK